MSDIQKIRQEIERLKNEQLSIFNKGENDEICGTALICIGVYNQLLSFINSLPEEPTSEDTCLLGHDYKNRDCENCSFELCKRFSKPASGDLEEELHSWMRENCDNNGFFNQLELARHFAEWQKRQMFRNAQQSEIYEKFSETIAENTTEYGLAKLEGKYKVGDKVRLIVLPYELYAV